MLFESGTIKLNFDVDDDDRFFIKGLSDTVCFNGTLKSECGGNTIVCFADGENYAYAGDRNIASGIRLKFEGVTKDVTPYGKLITVTESGDDCTVKSFFELFDDANVISAYRTVTNTSGADKFLFHLNSFSFINLFEGRYRHTFVNIPYNSHESECMWRKVHIADMGIFSMNGNAGTKALFLSSRGSQSTKNYLPMLILENDGDYLAVQIESGSLWNEELGLFKENLYLNLCGGSFKSDNWFKRLKPGESFTTCKAQIAPGNSLDTVIGELTKFRRLNKLPFADNVKMPIIFNEFMHCAFGRPHENNTRELAKNIAGRGVEYYVIDAGWHDEDEAESPTQAVGLWRESRSRYPGGLKDMINYIKSLGMKAGLWIEIQSVGTRCVHKILDKDCYFQFKGIKVPEHYRYQLDFRNPKVIEYVDRTVERIINEYGIEYIKIDYNHNHRGTDIDSESFSGGLYDHSIAYLKWLEKTVKKYPDVVFETCASGGQCLDGAHLKLSSIYSISDQEDALGFAHIAANMLSAITSEQAAVWSFPLNSREHIDSVTEEKVILNMINSMFGRMHLAGKFYLLGGKRAELIDEGIGYYNYLSKFRHTALPVFFGSFNRVEDTAFACGIKNDTKLFFAVYGVGEKETLKLDLSGYTIVSIKQAYPVYEKCDWAYKESGMFSIEIGGGIYARIFEAECATKKGWAKG